MCATERTPVPGFAYVSYGEFLADSSVQRVQWASGAWMTTSHAYRGPRESTARQALATFSTQLRSEQSEEDKRRASASAMYYMPFMTPDGLIASYRRYNQVIREVAAATGAVLIDGEDTIPGDSRHFTDTVHFTDAGSDRMAVRVRDALSGDDAVRSVLRSGVARAKH